jgi:hypothetical protein
MAYVSCCYAPPPALEGGQQNIICTDEAGTEWWLSADSQVGDWLRFKEGGGEVTSYEEPSR